MQDKLNKERPKIQDQFADLKRGLNSVSAEEWENLPEVGNIAGRGRKKANFKEKFTPVPDSLLPRAQEEMATTLDAQVWIKNTGTEWLSRYAFFFQCVLMFYPVSHEFSPQ